MSKKLIVLLSLIAILGLVIPAFAQDESESTCVSCHSGLEGRLFDPVKSWEGSIHKEKAVGCSDCHGGNPKDSENAMAKSAGFIGTPSPAQIPSLCAKCHSDPKRMRQYNLRTDQYALYKTSVHGKQLLLKGDEKVATCVSCHGAHAIQSPLNPQSQVYRTNLPLTCAKCHSNKELMDKYNLPSNQLEEYKQSYHGTLLLQKGDLRVANCADCHGTHGATPPGVKEIANVCGNCHGLTEEYFNQSRHKNALDTAGIPRCIDCHGNHNIKYPNASMFQGSEEKHCGSCHSPSSNAYQTAQTLYNLLSSFEAKVKKSLAELNRLKTTGIDIALLEEQANEINTKIIEAIPITHTLHEDLVKEKIEEGDNLLSEVQNSILKIKRESLNRKKIFSVVITVILIIIFLLYLKIKSL